MPVPARFVARRARSLAIVVLLVATASVVAVAADGSDPLSGVVADTVVAIAPTAKADANAAEPGLMRQVHDRAADMAASAMNFIGVRYRRGGQSAETGFDCSGFTRHVFELSGLSLPRRADEQAAAKNLVPVKRGDLKPGDLVFFNTMRRTFSHVGIYIGENRFIHAPSRGKDVRTDDLGFAYWAKRFTGARRAETPGDVATSAAAADAARDGPPAVAAPLSAQ